MEQQLPTAAASAPKVASAETGAPSNAAMYASQNRQHLLKLAIQRQQEQEERQQQDQQEEPRPPSHLNTRLKQHEQELFVHREQHRQYAQQQQQLHNLYEEQSLKCVHLRDKRATMQESTCTALGSGSVSTANSGSEIGSRSASDDEEERESYKCTSTRRALGGVTHKEGGRDEISNLPETQQHTQKLSEKTYKQQLQSGSQHHEQQIVERSQQYQRQPQQEQHRSLQSKVYQQHELQWSRLQTSQPPFEEQGVQEDLSLQWQQQGQQEDAWKLIQQQRVGELPPQQQEREHGQFGFYAEAVAASKYLTLDTEEMDLRIDSDRTILNGLLPEITTAHGSAVPRLTPRHSTIANMAPSAPGNYHLTRETDYVGWPVRPARKKKELSTLPPRPTASSSPLIAAAKGGVRKGTVRLYRNSRITEVKSFAGTLEDYLMFRRQQAEREEATVVAAQSRNNSSPVAAPAADHDVFKRKAVNQPSSSSHRAASTGQHFTENTAATRSSRSSSRATSAGRWPPQPAEAGVKDVDFNKKTTADFQSRWKEHLQKLFAWRRNAGLREQTHKTTNTKLQHLSRQASRDSQHDRDKKSTAAFLSPVAEEQGALPAEYGEGNFQSQEQRSGGLNSCLRCSPDGEEESLDEGRLGMMMLNNFSGHQTDLRAQAEQRRLDGNSGSVRQDAHTHDNAKFSDGHAHKLDFESNSANQEREDLEARKENTNNAGSSGAGKRLSRNKERKFIPVEIKNGEIVWPTDRPVIPLNAWIFQNFTADEPLDPQSWVHLPNVGTVVSPPAIPIPPAGQQNKCSPTRPPLPCGTASLVQSLFAEGSQTGPVKLPPVKLPVGHEFSPFTIYTEARPDPSTLPIWPPNYPAQQLSGTGERQRSRSLTGKLGTTPPEKPKSVYTQCNKQSYVKHRLTNFEGLVVRAEEGGRVLLVRSKEGFLRKLRRDDCKLIGFTCVSAPSSEHLLTDAAHLHARRLLSATLGSVPQLARSISCGSDEPGDSRATDCPIRREHIPHFDSAAMSAGKISLQSRTAQRREATPPKPQHSFTKHASSRAAAPRSASLPPPRSQPASAFFSLLNFTRESLAASCTRAPQQEGTCNSAHKLQTQQLQALKIPDVQQVLAQHHATATMHNTVALKNMATVPSIRAIDNQVTVEAIRVKKYMLEGKAEDNLIPVFSGGAPEDHTKDASAIATAVPAAASYDKSDIVDDARRLLLQKHEAREELKKREMEMMGEEIIYAQDAPEATRASGIAPPTIVKDTLVIPPNEDEPSHYIWQAPGIVPPLSQSLKLAEKPQQIKIVESRNSERSEVSSNSTETPNLHQINEENRRGEDETRKPAVDSTPSLHTEGPAWFTDLKAQFKSQLLEQYKQTGSLEAAALAVSSGGFTPLIFTDPPPLAIQRKQAKVLRDELRQMRFAPVEPGSLS